MLNYTKGRKRLGMARLGDFLSSINEKKQVDSLDGYVPFHINKVLTMFPDTLFYANEMNLNHHIPKKWNHDYYFHSLRKRKRQGTGTKIETNDDLRAIMTYFKMSPKKAREALSTLPSSEITKIKQRLGVMEDDCGGKWCTQG